MLGDGSLISGDFVGVFGYAEAGPDGVVEEEKPEEAVP